jgi:hypothetical protein
VRQVDAVEHGGGPDGPTSGSGRYRGEPVDRVNTNVGYVTKSQRALSTKVPLAEVGNLLNLLLRVLINVCRSRHDLVLENSDKPAVSKAALSASLDLRK